MIIFKKTLVLLTTIFFSFLMLLEVGNQTDWLDYEVSAAPIVETTTGSTELEIEGDYVANRVLIKYVEPALKLFYKAPDFSDASVVSYKTILLPNQTVTSKLSFSTSTVWYQAELVEGTSVEIAIEELLKIPGVLLAEPDYIRSIDTEGDPVVVDEINDTDDSLLSEQYYLEAVNIPEARQFLADHDINPGGDRSIIVAVIDTGVDYSHPDLAANMWVNSGEIAGDGIDNDNNGYIDDIYGASTVGNEYDHTGDPYDYHGHGTHVAGIIAADGDNGLGIRGVADNVRIMAVKASGSSGFFNTSDIVEAINYAVEMGADVINMSFGGISKSTIEMEALEIAFNTSVLVASAGNSSLPNYPEPRIPGVNFYPASLNFVIGVMASDQNNVLASFSNFDYYPQDSNEYEVVAPGRQIISTLPGDKYAKWDGTSMSAPIISGIAALLKSYFNDPSSHSTRFIMSQIIGTADNSIAIPSYFQPYTYWSSFNMVNAYNAFVSTPSPEITVFEHYLFDGEEVAAGNNGNGVIDAGETIDLAFILRNHWGKADNVVVKIDTLTPSGQTDPYVTMITDTVEFGAVGTFNTDDNGLIYNEDLLITGVRNPFQFSVSPDTPNDYYIIFNITITCVNGLDFEDTTPYTFKQKIVLTVRSGQELPSVIEEDMTLTNDTYWIIPNATLIPAGVTVTVEPGTSIQFWSNDPEDVYADMTIAYLKVEGTFNVEGTEDNPVKMFPSELKGAYPVMIFSGTYQWYNVYDGFNSNGNVNISYAIIANPNIGANTIDHSKFYQNYNYLYQRYLEQGEVAEVPWYGTNVHANYISNSIFTRLGSTERRLFWVDDKFSVRGVLEGNLFDSCYMEPRATDAVNNVFLNNFILESSQWGDRWYFTSSSYGIGTDFSSSEFFNNFEIARDASTGTTYVRFSFNFNTTEPPLEIANNFAKSLGGYLVDINSYSEEQFLFRNFSVPFYIGLKFDPTEGYVWYSGEPVTYTNWSENYMSTNHKAVAYMWDQKWGVGYNFYPSYFIVEIPGEVLIEDIYLFEEDIYISEISNPVQIDYALYPSTAETYMVTFTSSDESVVTVDDNGVITPVSIGDAVITLANYDDSIVKTVNVHVTEYVALTSFEIASSDQTLKVGEISKVKILYTPTNTTEKSLVFSSSDDTIAKVDQYGNVTALAGGQTIISVTTPDGSILRTVTITVEEDVEKVSFLSHFEVVVLGEDSEEVVTLIEPFTATDKTLTYESSNPDVAYVDETGKLVGVSVGTVVIRVTSSNPEAYDEMVVSVVETAINQEKAVDIAITSYDNNVKFFTLMENGDVWVFGSNTTVATKLNVSNIVQIESYQYNIIMLDENGKIYYQTYVQDQISLTEINSISNVIKVAVGGYHFLALTSDGTVWGWGSNNYGQLGSSGYGNWNSTIVQLDGLTDIKDITATYYTSFFLNKDGNVYALGYSGSANYTEPTQLSVSNIKQIQPYDFSGIYVFNSSNSVSILYANNQVSTYNLTRTDINTISRNYDDGHELVLLNNGTIISYGQNGSGQLGIRTFTDTYNYNNTISNFEDVKVVATGRYESAAIKTDGNVYVWGNNSRGQLIDFTNENRSYPILVNFGLVKETTSLNVESISPENDAEYVGLSTPIVIEFNQAIVESDSYAQIRLLDGDQKFVSIIKEIKLNKLYIYPISEFEGEVTYTVSIPSNAVKGLFGQMNGSITTYFTTEPGELYVKNIIINENEISISNNGLPYQIDYELVPYLVDDTFVTWSSSDESVVTVNEHGVLTPVGLGDAIVSVTDIDGTITRNITVHVTPYIPLVNFEVSVSQLHLYAGEVYTFNITYLPVDTTETVLTWTSSDETVAKVTKFGVLTALAGGTATITATSPDGSVSTTISLTVEESMTGVGFSSSFMLVPLSSDPIVLNPIINPVTATDTAVGYISSNEAIGYVNELGELIVLAEGTFNLRVYSIHDETIYGDIIITVDDIDFNQIQIVKVVQNEDRNLYALDSNGNVWVWGDRNGNIPKRIEVEPIIDLDGNSGAIILLGESSTIYTSAYYYVGNNLNQINAIPNVVSVSASANYFLALTSEGKVWGWGYNENGGLSPFSVNESMTYFEMSDISDVKMISTIGSASYYLTNSGDIYYRGYAYEGSIGVLTKISTQKYDFIKRDSSGAIIGTNLEGKLYRLVPNDVNVQLYSSLTNMVDYASQYVEIMLMDDGTVYGRGDSSYGFLGFIGYSDNPVQIEGLENIAQIYVLRYTTFFVTTDGVMFGMGRNQYNMLGIATSVSQNTSPVYIPFGLLNYTTSFGVKSTSPVSNEEIFDVDQPIVLTFDRNITDYSMFANISLLDEFGHYVSVTKTIMFNKLVITPNQDLAYDTNYAVVLPSSSLKDFFTNQVNSYMFSFTTRPVEYYVRDIILNETNVFISNNGLPYQLDFDLKPYVVDDTYLNFESSNGDVVSVNEHGVIMPVGPGNAVITIASKDGSVSKTININVAAYIPMTNMQFVNEEKVVFVGEVYKVAVNYTPLNTTESKMTWTSSDPSVATVDSLGNVTLLTGGEVTISAVDNTGVFTDSILLHVQEPVTIVDFEDKFMVASINDTIVVPVTVGPDTATNKTLIWESSNESVAYVDETGTLIILQEGLVVIRATAENTEVYDEIIISIVSSDFEDLKAVDVVYSRIGYEYETVFALMDDGSVWYWGENQVIPTKLPYSNIIDIDSYGYYSFAMVDQDSNIYVCRYFNDYVPYFNKYTSVNNIVKIEAGYNHYLFLTSSGIVWGLESNGSGQLGGNETTNYSSPIQIQGLSNVVDIAAGNSTSYFLLNDGSVYMLGSSNINKYSPYLITNLTNVTSIDTPNNSDYLVAKTVDMKVYLVSNGDFHITEYASSLTDTIDVSFGTNHNMYLTSAGEVYTTGNNSYGQLGVKVQTGEVYQHVLGLSNIVSIFALNEVSFAIDQNGVLYGFGKNTDGQLANLTSENTYEAQKIFFGLSVDSSAIQVTEANPSSGEMFFNPTSHIVIELNKAVYKGTNYAYIRLYDKNGEYVNFTKELTLNKLIITPSEPLNYEETYRLYIPSGALKDIYGTNGTVVEYSFKTAPEIPYVYDVIVDQSDVTLSTLSDDYQIDITLTPSQYVDISYINFSSSDENVVTVDQNGLVHVIGVGNASISIKTNDERIEKLIDFTVLEAINLEGISFSTLENTIYVGIVSKLDPIFTPTNTTETELIFTSSDSTIARVDAFGNVTALKGGTVTITATSKDGQFSASITINVEQPVSNIHFDDWAYVTSLETTGETLPLTIYPESATDKTIIWESSDPSIAYVDENGVLIKLSVGNVLISAKSEANELVDQIYVSISETTISSTPVKTVSMLYSDWSNSYFLTLMDDGSVWISGSNFLIPQKLQVSGIKDIDAGNYKYVMLAEDDTIYYSGSTIYSINSFQKITSLSNIVQVSAGESHYVALDTDGNIWGWGNNNYGELGAAGLNTYVNMTLVYGGGDAVKIASSSYTTAFITSAGDLYALGRIYESNHTSPLLLSTSEKVVDIHCDADSSIIVQYASGTFNVFRTYDQIYSISNVFNEVSKLSNIIDFIYADYNGFALALTSDGSVYSYGYNQYGQLGLGYSDNSYHYFEKVLIDEPVVYIGVSRDQGIAIGESGKVYVWGNNQYGKLGTFDTENQPTPVSLQYGLYPESRSLSLSNQSVQNNSTDISVNASFTFTYNIPILPGNNAYGSYLLDSNGKYVAMSVNTSLKTLEFTPLTTLKYNETYRLYIYDRSVMSYNGEYNSGIEIYFTTESQVVTNLIDNTVYQEWTLEMLQEAAQSFIDEGMSSGVYNNAILNNITDPNTDTWMRFIANSGENYKFLTYNYWGTTDEFLIGKQIRDYEDYPDLSKIIYKPFLTVAPETAYPFVTEVYLSTDLEERTSIVSIGEQTFTVRFNRDMDLETPLGVYFGPDYPYTDYKVDGDWVDARTWVGTFNITPLTGDGKQYFRIRDGRAADDHWLTLGDDDGRFLFEIISSGAESMNLQASGAEGRIILSWIQDDFDLLAGYDIYRSSSIDGTYTKINTSVVPKDEKEFSDFNVTPGVVYYYKFTVVKTDFTESDFSNTAAAASYDTIAPYLYHNPVRTVNLGTEIVINATAFDNIGLQSILVYYRAVGDTTYKVQDLIKGQNSNYSTRIYIDDTYMTGFEYYIVASDDLIDVYNGSDTAPNVVTVKDVPTLMNITPTRGNVTGGDTITISGSNFKDGAKVFFGNTEGLNVTVIDETTIEVRSPNYYPSLVNITVQNPSGDSSVLTNGFEYYTDQVQLQIPTVKGQVNQEILVPINVQNLKGLLSADMQVTYDHTILQYVGYVKGNIATRFTVMINSSVADTVTIAMASDVTISGSGDIIYLKFKVIGTPETSSAITIKSASLNGGNISVLLTSGSYIEDLVYSFTGTIYYYANSTLVQNVRIVISGEYEYISTSSSDGKYNLQEIEPGDYTMTIEKRDETAAISAFDASMILQKAVGITNFSENQMFAADVNNDGAVNSFDAALILQYVAGLRVLPFEGRTEIWKFITTNTFPGTIASNYSNQTVTAILIGDVSGNYAQTTSQGVLDVIKIEQISVLEETNTITVPISIKSLTEGIFSIETTLYFDSSLTVSQVSFSPELENYLKVVNTNNAGEVRIVLAGTEALSTVDEFVLVTFNINNASIDKFNFSIGQTLFNENANIQAVNNVLNLVFNADLNNDGVVDQSDIDFIINHINKTHQDEDISAMDYNHDGIIDIYDIIERQKTE